MTQEFDVVVIGTGAAGSTVALGCAQAGRRVAIVDKRPFGGTCALRGCDPKKVLVGPEEIVHRRHDIGNVLQGALAVDWPQLMRFKRTFTDPVPGEREASYRDAGITCFHGEARFSDPSTIAVNGDALRATNIVLGAGSRPVTLGIPGEAYITTSEQFLNLDALPRRIVFIGGGYISFEFAHLVARYGADATILHRGARALPQFDADLVSRLVDASRDAGITIELNSQVRGVERTADGLTVQTDRASFTGDMVVHGAGRVPEIDDLDLERGNVQRSKRGVTVNAFLQSTSNPNVYAAGDSADSGGPPLTPVGSFTGEIVVANMLHGNHREADFSTIPSLVFSNPVLAAVGVDDVGDGVEIKGGDMSSWYSYRRIGERYAAYKLFVHKAEDRVLGAHFLGPGTEELINVFTLAIRHRIPAAQLRDMIYAYPTYTSDIAYML
ncbi:MAG: NAD(P)/FAD-dependent oxidoreductase [Candidatus Eremiobacteraeota bacterium]|nr:NAD(P)/FAD-dependent oxidoreductase [Candidatus Eremiobacteraeota bacterium]